MRKSAPIHVVVHSPSTEEDARELALKAAGIHADMVERYIQKLNCSAEQKTELLEAVITTAKNALAGG